MSALHGLVGRTVLAADRVLLGITRSLLPRRAARLLTARILGPALVALDRLVMK